MVKYFLVADIGGTNSTLALIKIINDDFEIVLKRGYKTNEFGNLDDLINDFVTFCVTQYKILLEDALFAIAGVISNEKIKLTNGQMLIDINGIKKKTSIKRMKFINDFTAIAYSIPDMKKESLIEINKGKIKTKSVFGVIGAGTGLGKAIIYNKNDDFIVINSEGGHCDFPVYDKEELKLINFIRKKENKEIIEFEDLISGRGIENIYEFLSKKKMSAAEISMNKSQDKNAKMTFKLFYRFYARVVKNFALEILPEQGIYIGGGIISKNLKFSKKDFMEEFTNNSVHKELLKQFPIYIIKDYNVSIDGLVKYVISNY